MDEKKLVEYVSKLARVEVSAHEEADLAAQLAKILDYINKLKEVNVENVEPMRGTIIERNVLRQDQVLPSNLQEDILNDAPSREGNYFKVPKIIE